MIAKYEGHVIFLNRYRGLLSCFSQKDTETIHGVSRGINKYFFFELTPNYQIRAFDLPIKSSYLILQPIKSYSSNIISKKKLGCVRQGLFFIVWLLEKSHWKSHRFLQCSNFIYLTFYFGSLYKTFHYICTFWTYQYEWNFVTASALRRRLKKYFDTVSYK